MTRAALLITMLIALTACGSAANDNAANAPTKATAKAPAVRQKTVFDAQLKPLDKARGVQKIMDQEKAHTDQAIKDSGG